MERIAQAAQMLKARGATSLRLRLHSPNLGVLQVDLCVRQGLIHGTWYAESAAARDLLVAHLDQLKAALEAQGLHVGEFQMGVDPSFQQASGDPSWTNGSNGSGKREDSGEDETGGSVPEAPAGHPGEQRIFDMTI